MKLTVPSRVEAALIAFAEENEITPQEAGKRLMEDLNAAFRFGTPAFLGPAWQKEPTVGIPVEGGGQAKARDVAVEPTLTPEQIQLLERSSRLASGFAGVYQTPGGWRALGPDKKWMKTRPTALWAAWDRHQAIAALPKLDPVEETAQWLRGRMPGASEEEVQKHARELEELKNGPLPPGM